MSQHEHPVPHDGQERCRHWLRHDDIFTVTGLLASTRIDYNGEEVKTAQLVTWRQLEPALPPPGNAGCLRAADLLEGWARACMEDPTKTLLPEDKRPDELPQPQVWVESQKDWHEICAGAADRGIFTFLEEQDVFHFQGRPVLNGTVRSRKEEQKFGQR